MLYINIYKMTDTLKKFKVGTLKKVLTGFNKKTRKELIIKYLGH